MDKHDFNFMKTYIKSKGRDSMPFAKRCEKLAKELIVSSPIAGEIAKSPIDETPKPMKVISCPNPETKEESEKWLFNPMSERRKRDTENSPFGLKNFMTFKVPTQILNDVLKELKSIELPCANGVQLVYLDVHETRKPRISEISCHARHVGLMVSLRHSWDEFHKIQNALREKESEVAKKVYDIMVKFKACMRDYNKPSWERGSKWIQLN